MSVQNCDHCGRPVPASLRVGDWELKTVAYCCSGCEIAAQVIRELDLLEYYELSKVTSQEPQSCRAPESELCREAIIALDFWDSAAFSERYCSVGSDAIQKVNLAIGGLSCYSCVWLLERAIGKKFPGVRMTVNLARGSGQLAVPSKQALSPIIQLITRLGFRVSPLAPGTEPASRVVNLIDLALAACVALNLMALAAADYLSASTGLSVMPQVFAQGFRWISLGLATPAILFSGRTFFRNAWRQACAQSLSLDSGITIAIIIGLLSSVTNVVRGVGAIYFDTLCGGIAVLLAGRLALTAIVRRIEESLSRPWTDVCGELVRLVKPTGIDVLPLESVKVGDRFRVLPGEVFPLLSRVTAGDGSASLEAITGEPRSMRLVPKATVPAGAKNGSTVIDVVATEDGSGSLLNNVQGEVDALMKAKGRTTLVAEIIATYFYGMVLLATVFFGVSAFVFSALDAGHIVERCVAGVLIACPCAFGFAAPLCVASRAKDALRRGVAFRSVSALENLWRSKRIYFDKTGTLTSAKDQKCSVALVNGWDAKVLAGLIQPLLSRSEHRWAKLLQGWCGSLHEEGRRVEGDEDTVIGFSEFLGRGMTATVRGRMVQIGNIAFIGAPLPLSLKDGVAETVALNWDETYVAIDQEIVARARSNDSLIEGAVEAVRSLYLEGREVSVLSGDRSDRVSRLAEFLPLQDSRGEMLPHEKAKLIKESTQEGVVTMIGNGSNDALALARSSFGIAVWGSNGAARRAADIVLLAPGLNLIQEAFCVSRELRRSVFLTFGFAAVYNVSALLSAWGGLVSPGFAAIAMPVSSIFIIALTQVRPAFPPRRESIAEGRAV